MTRIKTGIIIFLLLLVLCGCSGNSKYEPFQPLSKETVSPQRDAEIQAALNGDVPAPVSVPVSATEENPFDTPSFDENSFFAEVDPTVPEAIVRENDATATPSEPTATPLPTPTKPYDPNIMMYGTSNGLTTYTMQDGDFLICIARRFDISLSQLMAQNGISNPDDLGVGDTVILPRNPTAWSMMDGYGRRTLILHPTTYTTQAGDTLFSIACQYGDVLPEDIAVQNQLVLGELLQSGLTIVIP